MIALRLSAFVVAPHRLRRADADRAHAQWWRSAPVDFEACADPAEKAKTKEDKTAALAECNAKFAGRRKPGGGYTYYDFMQDRTFDIAGPNPTSEEQKKIDEQYTVYLETSGATASPRHSQPSNSSSNRAATRAAGVAAQRDRKGTGAGGEPGQAGRAHQGSQLRQELIFLRVAAALGGNRRSEEAVQRVADKAKRG